MAVPPNSSNEAFLREVDEELRRDQLANAWRDYGRWLIAAIIVGLAIFAAVLWWRSHQEKLAGEQGEQLQQVYDDIGAGAVGNTTAPLAALSQAKGDGYRALAQFTQADLLLQKRDDRGAAAKFAAIAADQSLDQPFRDLALVRQTAAEFDQLPPNTVVTRLRPLAVPGNPWFGSAGELVAAAYLKMNRADLAGTLFGQIAHGPDVPDTIRQRAVQMAGVLGVDAVAQPKEAPKS